MVTGQEARRGDWSRGRYLNEQTCLIALITAMVVAHLGLLRVPYFWDEVYFASAARDLFLSGRLIPTSVPVESHPPLVLIWVASFWKLFDFSIPVARTAMLALAALTLAGVHRLARLLTTGAIPIVVTALTAVYPVFFTHCTMVSLDLPAAGLTLWGLAAYLSGRPWRSALLFSLAVLTKETAIAAPLALLALESARAIRGRMRIKETTIPQACRTGFPLLVPLFVLLCWFTWLNHASATFLGDHDYVQSNLYDALHPMRIVLSCVRQLFHLLGYLNLFVLTLSAASILVLCPVLPTHRTPEQSWRPWLALAAVVAGYVLMLSFIGNVQLPRYLLSVDPLVILASLAVISARVKWWPVVAGLTAVAFLTALFTYPSFYGLVLEDNLAYLDYVELHQEMALFLDDAPKAKVLTKYPASSELTEPWLGYVKQPMQVSEIDDLTPLELTTDPQVTNPQNLPEYLVMFPTIYAPPNLFPRPRWWRHGLSLSGEEELSPEEVASKLNARVVYFARHRGDWITVLKIASTNNALQNQGEQPRPAYPSASLIQR